MKFVFTFLLIIVISTFSNACTNLIITKGASADGSTMLVYTNDGEWLYKPQITFATDYTANEYIHYGNDSIPQIPHTNKVFGFQMNEYQVCIGETTFTGREELWDKSKPLKYWHLMYLALQRSKTAKEAIEVITNLVELYGYGSEGESISVIDPNEAWILEIIGTGGAGGAVWVAIKIPDGYVSAHANMARIGAFSMKDPENCLYSDNIMSFAIEKGFYDPKSGIPFKFNEAYNPPTPDRLKYCETRVWSLFSRMAPSLNLSPDYHRGVEGAERYPLWIKPDHKISLYEMTNLVRTHYENTPFDMTTGLASGPFSSPNFCRPLFWEVDSTKYSWERPISTMNTAFSFIAQCRNYLPDDIGGVLWFGVDDTFYTCYIPIYIGCTEVPEAFTKGDINKFSWDSMWWVFNFVSNYSNLRYSEMIKDIQLVQKELENKFITEQDSILNQMNLITDKTKRSEVLTNYSQTSTKLTHQKWIDLGEYLITKYNDGYIKNINGNPKEKGYSDEWKKKVIQNDSQRYKIPEWNKENNLENLSY